MDIDPFTFAAQVFNFLVLVGLLRHFLYRPVLSTMDAREKFVAEQMEKAKEAKLAAEGFEQKRAQELLEANAARSERLAEVKAEVDRFQQEGLARARQEIAEMGQRWREAKNREIESWGAIESQRLTEVVLGIARAALADLATADLETQMVDVLLAQAETLPVGATKILSAFPLQPESERKLLSRFPGAVFELSPELLAGLVIRVNDHKVSWSLESYLEGLGQKLRQC